MTVSYEVCTTSGQPIRTFDSGFAAIEWARAHKRTFPGLRVDVVERIERRRLLWEDIAQRTAA